MRQATWTMPKLALVVGTRATAGFGIGLLSANHVSVPVRRLIGSTLARVGLRITVPLALDGFEPSEPVMTRK